MLIYSSTLKSLANTNDCAVVGDKSNKPSASRLNSSTSNCKSSARLLYLIRVDSTIVLARSSRIFLLFLSNDPSKAPFFVSTTALEVCGFVVFHVI